MLNGLTTARLRWWRRLLPAFVGLLGALLVLLSSGFSEGLFRRSYDWLHQLAGVNDAALDASSVVIVYIDRDSYNQLGLEEQSGLWPRELHARLINRLRRDGAKAVVMDIIFSSPGSDPTANAALAKAIHENGRVVLGAGFKGSTSSMPFLPQTRALELELPIEQFGTNAAAVALTTTRIDDDFTCRRHFAGMPSIDSRSLAYATADILGIKPGADETANNRWMRYYGPPLQIPHLPYYRALDEMTPDSYFRDRVVLIGAQPLPGDFTQRGDEWKSPYVAMGQSDSFMPGVEIHATELLNLMRGDWLTQVPLDLQALALLAYGIACGWLAIRLRPAIAIPVQALLAVGILILAILGISSGNLWFAWMVPVAVQTPVSIVGGLTYRTVEWFIVRRHAERRIREQAELIDKARDSIRLFDLAGRLQLANPRARELFASVNNDELSLDFDSEPANNARNVLLAQGQWQGEMTRGRSADTELVLASRWTLIRNEEGQPTGILVIDTDITEQKQLELQLARAQRMEMVGAIAGGMAHDLNNSLAPLLMGVQLLKRRHEDDPTRRTLDHMEQSARRGAEMVRQVLSFARGRGTEFEPLNPALLIKEMSRLAKETFPPKIQVEASVAGDVWLIAGNATQLHQVLLNLCVNARDAMPAGGTLSLVADNALISPEEAEELSDARSGEFVCFMVNDTGAGIPAEHLPRLYEAFFTTKPEGQGTGLGLPTVKRIVENHGGFMRVQSTAGEGTSFEVYLPRSSAAKRIDEDASGAQLPRGKGETILIVEDTEGVRELMSDTLVEQGYVVHSTGIPSEALDKVDSGNWQPVLLVIDVNLPGISGPDLIAALRRLRGTIPAIMVSSEEPSAVAGHSKDITFLRKPVEADDLLGMVSRLLAHNHG